MLGRFLMAQSKSSTLFKYFCVATSDAIFQVWEGDARTPGTREHVKAHLRRRYKLGVGVDMTDPQLAAAETKRVDELIKRVRRGYWRSHCRFSITSPRELARRLLSVYFFFRDMDDPETGRPFFSSGHEAICRRELGYVAKGELSDHPTIPLYFELRRLSSGLVLSRCLRTSSGLEGYHQHLENAVSKCAKAAGLRFTEAMTNEFDWRWTVRAVREAGLIPGWVRHYNLSMIEYLHDTAVKLLGAVDGPQVVPGWRRTKLMAAPLVKHGMHYGLEAQKRQGQGQPTEPLRGEAGWVAERMGEPRPLRHRKTAADVDALLCASADATPVQLSDMAFQRGLHLAPAAAERFREEADSDERARLALTEAGYRELQQTLRTRVQPPQVTEAVAPQLAQTIGGDALPGPHPGMDAQVMQPAELEPMEEPMEEEADGNEAGNGAVGRTPVGGKRNQLDRPEVREFFGMTATEEWVELTAEQKKAWARKRNKRNQDKSRGPPTDLAATAAEALHRLSGA